MSAPSSLWRARVQAGANLSYRELERAVRSLERGGSSASRVTTAERTSALKMMAMVVAGAGAQSVFASQLLKLCLAQLGYSRAQTRGA
eukprot:324921-Pleurochrysis_carterae.AAC.1